MRTDYDIRRCNQFILGPSFVSKYSGWKQITIENRGVSPHTRA